MPSFHVLCCCFFRSTCFVFSERYGVRVQVENKTKKEGKRERHTHNQSLNIKTYHGFWWLSFSPTDVHQSPNNDFSTKHTNVSGKKVSAKKTTTTTKMMIFKIVNEHKRIPRCLICSTVCKRLAKEKTLAHIVSSTIAWWLRMTGQVA